MIDLEGTHDAVVIETDVGNVHGIAHGFTRQGFMVLEGESYGPNVTWLIPKRRISRMSLSKYRKT